MIKKKELGWRNKKIVRSLNTLDLADINDCLDKAYAFTYALHTIASGDGGGLEDLGDDDAFIILDEVVVHLQQAKKVINEGVEKAA